MAVLSNEMRDDLIATSETADRSTDWPAKSWQLLRDAGVLGNSIPRGYGGNDLDPVGLQRHMESIASSCLTTAFILSQREAAIRNLLKAPEHLKQRYLHKLASGEQFLTVGLSQLTTSRQHQGPALRATPLPDGAYQLNGEIPWVTGADHADAIVAGATLADGSQLLVVIPADGLQGMIEPPLPLSALAGSRTSLIRCRNVMVKPEDVLIAPTQNVLGKSGGGGLDTSCLAIGLSAAAIDFMTKEATSRSDLAPIATRFSIRLESCRSRLHQLAESPGTPEETLALREDCTKLVLRATQASLMVAKGIGFVTPHPVQRWARQATFFLVWSCPRPVAEGVLADLASW